MYVFPFSLKGHLDSLLAAFAQTGGRLVDHPSFPVFTGWCEQHADALGLEEPTNNTVDVVSLAHLNLNDLDLRDKKDIAEDEPISDEMRFASLGTGGILGQSDELLEAILVKTVDLPELPNQPGI